MLSDLGKASDFGKFDAVVMVSDLEKAIEFGKVNDLGKASDLENAMYLSLSTTVITSNKTLFEWSLV